MPDKKKRKRKSASKASTENVEESQEIQAARFERELFWCIEQLEVGLSKENVTAKQAEEAVRVLKLLRNPKTPYIRKRQVMRVTFGDYRVKMEKEEKLAKSAMKKKLKLQKVPNNRMDEYTFFKRSKSQQPEVRCSSTPEFRFPPSDNEFKFVFTSVPEKNENVALSIGTSATTYEPITNFIFTPSDNSFKFKFGEQPDSYSEVNPNRNVHREIIPDSNKIELKSENELRTMENCDNVNVKCCDIEKTASKDTLDTHESAILLEVDQLTEKTAQLDVEGKVPDEIQVSETILQTDNNMSTESKVKSKTTAMDAKVKTDEDLEKENQAARFEKELCWCIEQLEVGLSKQNATAKQAEEAVRVLKLLKNPKTPFVKKRQAMRVTFGDYRAKIVKEEKQAKSVMKKKLKLNQVPTQNLDKCTFYKRSQSNKPKESYNSPSGLMFETSCNKFNSGVNSELIKNRNEALVTTPTVPYKPITNFTYIPSDNSFKFNFERESINC